MENHIVCIPFTGQGHIIPMLHLAQTLHFHFNFHITFIFTHSTHQSLFDTNNSNSNSNNNDGNNDDEWKENFPFEFKVLPHLGEYESKDDPGKFVSALMNNKLDGPIKELMSEIKERRSVRGVVCDIEMSVNMVSVAEEVGVALVVLDTISGCARVAYFQHRQLLDKGLIPLPDSDCLTNGYLDKIVLDWIPSMKGIHLRDLPSSTRIMNPQAKGILPYIIKINQASTKAQAILINTFHSLEPHHLEDLTTLSPNIYPIGPLHLLAHHALAKHGFKKLKIGLKKTKESPCDYLEWLDSQEPGTVIYVSMGSFVLMGQAQIVELGWGLVNSPHKFLWVVREGELLPSELKERVKGMGNGFLVSWCDQEEVLSHASVGGFLTHCGWNSTIESIGNGVPMMCWPRFGDQFTNSWLCTGGLGIGVRMSEDVKRGEVTRVVGEVMGGEKREEMVKKVLELKTLAWDATTPPNGSSYVTLEKIVNDVLLASSSKQ